MTKESKYAIFKYKKCDSDLIDGLASYLDEHGHIPFDFFEVDAPEEKVLIEVIPTKAQYDKECKSKLITSQKDDVPSWAVGAYSSRYGGIILLSPRDYKSTTHYMKDVPFADLVNHWHKTVVHEFTHYVQRLFNIKHGCSGSPKFLGEGIATYLSGQRDGHKIPFDFTLEQVLDKNSSYAYYYLITKYFVEHYDKDYVLDVFQSSRMAEELLKGGLYDQAKAYYSQGENT